MSVSLSDLKSSNESSKPKRRRKSNSINLAAEYSGVSSDVKKDASLKASQKALNSKISKIDKVIDKTDRILANPKYNLSATLELSKYKASITLASTASFSSNPSLLDFLNLRGNPKKVINYIIMNLNNYGFFESDTTDFLKGIDFKNNTLKSSLTRLNSRGFIKIVSVRGIAQRKILVNPSILNL